MAYRSEMPYLQARRSFLQSDAHRSGMGIVFIAIAACGLAGSLLLAGVGREPLELLSSSVLQGRSGHRAVLSSTDFVPYGSQSSAKMTATAKRQLDGLFAAAGVKMGASKLRARQSMLAQVKASPHKSFARRHLDIDRGSSERLVAAAENKLHAYDRKIHLGTYHSKVDLLKQDLGAKIAQYFEATSRMRGSN